MEIDIEYQRMIERTWIYRDGTYKIVSEDPYVTEIDQFAWDRKVISLPDEKDKWIFSNAEGCVVVYITSARSDGNSFVSDAYISSDEAKCEKRIPLSWEVF